MNIKKKCREKPTGVKSHQTVAWFSSRLPSVFWVTNHHWSRHSTKEYNLKGAALWVTKQNISLLYLAWQLERHILQPRNVRHPGLTLCSLHGMFLHSGEYGAAGFIHSPCVRVWMCFGVGLGALEAHLCNTCRGGSVITSVKRVERKKGRAETDREENLGRRGL